MTDRAFDPTAVVATLNRHKVRYIVVGAYALIAQGAPLERTQDIDVAPERTKANLGRLAAALIDMDARLRGHNVPDDLPFKPDAQMLADVVDFWNLTSRYGDLDLCFTVGGGYDQLALHAVRVEVGKLTVMVASVDDVIASKEAAGRPKDRRVLPMLEAWRAARSG